MRDVAQAHIRAFERPEAGGQRFLISAGTFAWQEVADVLRAAYPEEKSVPVGNPGQKAETWELDNTKAREVLGIQFIGLKQTVEDTAKQLLELRTKWAK